jgi:hypothetical protein
LLHSQYIQPRSPRPISPRDDFFELLMSRTSTPRAAASARLSAKIRGGRTPWQPHKIERRADRMASRNASVSGRSSSS